MVDSKYRDKKDLMQYDLSTNLFKMFHISVKDVIPIRSVFVLNTDQGTKILKRIQYTIEELRFIYHGILYTKEKFKRIMDFFPAEDGSLYVERDGGVYCLMNLVEGRECDYSNPVDMMLAARGLGEFHRASEGFRYPLPSKYQNGKMIEGFKRRLEEVHFFKHMANMHEHKTEFDKIFLGHVEHYLEDMEKSIEILESSPYYKLCSEEDKIVLCHHDLAYHNILIHDQQAYLVDFDYAVIDLKIHDLCNFITKATKPFAYDIEKAKMILSEYTSENVLDKRELKVLYGMLFFPEDFYSISRDYYTKRKDWEEDVFEDRLLRKIDNKDDKRDFLEQFSSVYSL